MSLTADQIKTKLQIANCCGGKKANLYINNLKKGTVCGYILDDLELLYGYIDAIVGYDPDVDNCITIEQVETILGAIFRICNGPCTDYVNFESN